MAIQEEEDSVEIAIEQDLGVVEAGVEGLPTAGEAEEEVVDGGEGEDHAGMIHGRHYVYKDTQGSVCSHFYDN